MNKTININLAGVIFHMDEGAYASLTEYLNRLKEQFSRQEGGDEILMDIEARIAEIFNKRLKDNREVIDQTDVDAIIEVMGQPEDYADADDETEEGTASTGQSYTYKGAKRMYRDSDDNILGGVCAGLAHYFGIDPIWFRLGFIALVLGAGTGFWLYIILWIVVPEAKTTAQKLQMKGEKINITNIEKTVKEEMRNVSQSLNDLGKSDKVRKSGSRIGKAIEDVFTAIFSIIISILKVALKIVGLAFLVGGVIVIVALVSAGIGYGVDVNGVNMSVTEAYTYLDVILPHGYTSSYVWLALLLTLVGPIVGIVFLGARILFNYSIKNKVVMTTAGLTSFVGIILFVILGFATAGDFQSFDRKKSSFAIANASPETTIEIYVNESDYNLERHAEWGFNNDELVIDDVDLDVRKTAEDVPYIEVYRESRGRGRSEASDLASAIQFEIVQGGSRIFMDPYLRVNREDKFRDQEVDVVLYLPEGYKVYLDESTRYTIYDIDNVTNTYDRNMVNHIWIMTTKGLACVDCPKDWNSNTDEASDEWEREWIEEAERMENDDFEPLQRERPEMPQRRESAGIDTVGINPNEPGGLLI